MVLYHYFDRRTGPFRSLTAMPEQDAQRLLEQIKKDRPDSFCAARDESYIQKRRNCEAILRREFAAKGGIMEVESPFYMVVEACPWLMTWYEQPDFLKIPIAEFDLRTVSFTYGDSMPTFSPRVQDGKEYRRTVYSYEEILTVIEKYGLPQDWNADGRFGPERYIEAHIWSRRTVEKWNTSLQNART